MNLRSHAVALVLVAHLLPSPAQALSTTDPRTPINAVETPGDADSVFRISQSGSYYLEANLLGVVGKSGIEVDASNVRIDLMGFRLHGVDGSVSAIRVVQNSFAVSIVNGTITSWDAFGVDGTNTLTTRVSDLDILSCEAGGIQLGHRADVERCNVLVTTGTGIAVGVDSKVSRCRVADAGEGISAGPVALVDDCTVESVATKGIDVGARSTIRGSVARMCGSAALVLGGGSSVVSCAASDSASGIFGSGSLRVIDSTIEDNASDGLRFAAGLVRGCSIARNGRGVEVSESAHIVGNLVTSNGQDGIRASAASRIEENDIRGHLNGAGIRVQGTGSYIVKNTLTKNASTILAPNAGNFVGTLVSTNGINGREDPWANLYSN